MELALVNEQYVPVLRNKKADLLTRWQELVAKRGGPSDTDPQHNVLLLDEVKGFRREAAAFLKQEKPKRLEITRQIDEWKSELIALENEFDEGKPGLAGEFKAMEASILEAQKQMQAKIEAEQARKAAKANLPADFTTGITKKITAYEGELQKTLVAKLHTTDDLDGFEKELLAGYALDEAMYRTWGNELIAELKVEKEDYPVILETNAKIKPGLLTDFKARMATFARELANQIPAMKEAVVKPDFEAELKAIEAETQARVEQVEAVGQRQADTAKLQAVLEAVPTVPGVGTEKTYEPATRGEWIKLLGSFLALPEAETGTNKEWFDSKLKTVATYMSKRLSFEVVQGVTVVEKVKVSRNK